jgi:hypothetical protein
MRRIEKMAQASLSDDERAELGRLEQKLQRVRLARKEVDHYDLADARRLAHTVYVEQNTPDSAKRAGAAVQRISNEMSTVWPEWGQAYMQVR